MTKNKVKPEPVPAVEVRSQAPTMSDVAELAGVSPMTVSRVMNGDTNVREKTRIRVDAAVSPQLRAQSSRPPPRRLAADPRRFFV